MNHRHLLPNEIDLLVDGEAGFGVAPLRAHILECDECRERLADAHVVVAALEALPHFAPSPRLPERVMAHVPVFIPAHVAARDTVRRWMPQSSVARIVAVAIGTAVTGTLTLAMAWLVAVQGDAVVFIAGLLGNRFRAAVSAAARSVAVALLGESALSALQAAGAIGTSLLVLGFLLAAVGTVAGLRRLAIAGRRA